MRLSRRKWQQGGHRSFQARICWRLRSNRRLLTRASGKSWRWRTGNLLNSQSHACLRLLRCDRRSTSQSESTPRAICQSKICIRRPTSKKWPPLKVIYTLMRTIVSKRRLNFISRRILQSMKYFRTQIKGSEWCGLSLSSGILQRKINLLRHLKTKRSKKLSSHSIKKGKDSLRQSK